MTLVQQLVQKKILDKEKAASLEFEIKSSGRKEEEVILGKKIVSESFLFKLKSENLKIPLKEVLPEDVPFKVLERIPEESAKYYKMIPIGKRDDLLEAGMIYPEDLKAQEALKFLTRQEKLSYKVFLITPTTFNNLLRQYRTLKKEVTKALEELEEEMKGEKVKVKPLAAAEFERLVEEAPISKVVAVMLRHAVEGRASDVHIEPTRDRLKIRFRLDGVLHSSLLLPLRIHQAVVARVKILSNMKIDEMRVPQDGRFSTKIDGKDIDFRVSTFPTTEGEKVAIRVLDPSKGILSLEELGMIGRNLRAMKEAVKKPYGMILATGPTGAGKTTTLYAVLKILNQEGVNIVALEDPVEYYIEGVNQSQMRPDIGYTFATGLRHVVRQDPDIIMVGEIRDEETASLATHAALTGHVVLSTLHTTNALGTIPRLVDLGIQSYLIPPTLSISLAQRLVRKLCPECKKKIKPKPKIRDLILRGIESFPPEAKKNFKISKDFSIFEPKGCKKCRFEGYSGRIGLFEVLEMTDSLSELIFKEPSEVKIAEEAKNQGMVTMKQDGILKVLDGITSIEEVLRVAEEK
ncbi:type II/IV secretion system protein [Patescibacteria group bacterium]|nr:type II/IV secretion system protein [Patescibacteria group bacterium]